MLPRVVRSTFALVLAAVGTACSEPALVGPGLGTPIVSFSYGGPISGAFEAGGYPSFDVSPLGQTFAQGRRYRSPDGFDVLSTRFRGSSADFVTIEIPRIEAGTFTIGGSCDLESLDCPAVGIALQIPTTTTVGQARYSCELSSGTIRLATVTTETIAGTFSGRGSCITDTGDELENFVVSDGRFEVGVVEATR